MSEQWIVLVVLASGSSAVVMSFLAIPVLRRYVLDHPNERSSHEAPVPRAGGVAVLCAIFVGLIIVKLLGGVSPPLGVTTGLVLFGLLGFLDDLTSLAVRTRLIAQVVLSIPLAWALLSDHHLALVFPAAFLITGFVNSFNFMDGINGISSGVGAVSAAWYLWHLVPNGSYALAGLAAAVLGACLGFGVPNLAGKLFLGDVGSYMLGSALVLLAVSSSAAGLPVVMAMAPLALYVLETLWAVLKRARRGARVGDAHREHVYQRLVDSGLSHVGVAAIVSASVMLMCLVSSLWPIAPASAVVGFVAVVTAYFALPRARHRLASAS